jgi:hypothetical protein
MGYIMEPYKFTEYFDKEVLRKNLTLEKNGASEF